MSLDITVVTESVTTVINQIFSYVPLGVALFGAAGALVGGLMFGERIIGVVIGALSRFGGGRK